MKPILSHTKPSPGALPLPLTNINYAPSFSSSVRLQGLCVPMGPLIYVVCTNLNPFRVMWLYHLINGPCFFYTIVPHFSSVLGNLLAVKFITSEVRPLGLCVHQGLTHFQYTNINWVSAPLHAPTSMPCQPIIPSPSMIHNGMPSNSLN